MSSSCVLGRDSGGTNAAVSDVRLSVMDVSEEIGFVRRSSGLSGGRPMDGWVALFTQGYAVPCMT